MSPLGAIFVPFPPKTGTKLLHPPPPPQSLNGSGGAVAYAEASSRVVSVDVEYDALGPAWRQLLLGFWSPWPSPSTALSLAAFVALSYRRDVGP